MFSSDGINWTEVTLESATWGACAYGNGTYVLVSTRQGVSKVAVSQNGINWTIKTLYSGSVGTLSGIAFGNGTFVVVRGIDGGQQLYYSEDNGSTWKTDYNINSYYQMSYPVFSKGKFIVTGYNSNKAAYSADGKNWTTVNLPSSSSWRRNLSTENAFLAYDYTTTAAYSIDGITWNSVNLPDSATPNSCFNKFIIKNGKNLYYSSDGNNWASLDLGNNFASSTGISERCKKEMITASTTTTDYATLGNIFDQCYTLTASPTTSTQVYEIPKKTSALTITSVGTGTITLSDSKVYNRNSAGDVQSPVLGTKTITSNDTYTAASDYLDGFSSVTVDVPSAPTKKYNLLDRVKDDSNNEIGTVSGFFTDANNVEYAVVCLDAQYRLASGYYCSNVSTEITNLPIYYTSTWGPWEAKETATYNTQTILDYCTSSGATSTACSHCRTLSFTIDEISYAGQLPNMIELNDIVRNHTALNTADTTASSYSSVNFDSGRSIWSSSQAFSSLGWQVSYGGVVGYNTKDTNYIVIPVLEIPNT